MKKLTQVGILLLCYSFTIFAGVPVTKTRNPSLPYFMERTNFQTILLNVYGNNISGVFPDQYGDLNWNPAYVLTGSENGMYIDFNYQSIGTSNYGYYNSSSYEDVSPKWYGNTYVNSLQLQPLFNFALIQKINDKLTIGIINRSIFDYGPFRSTSNSWYYSNSLSSIEYDSRAYEDLELKTVEVDDNQQSVWGTQTEFTLGYNLSPKIDIGMKLGHYIFRQSGDLYDSRYSKQPHSFIDELSDEDFKINGDQYEIGAGLIYHLDDKTNLGLYLSLMKGNSSENNLAIDNSDNWSETPTNKDYYSIREYDLESNYSFSSDGTSPFLTLTFEKEFSTKLSARSFFSFKRSNKEITSSINSTYTSYSDRTYDYYFSDNYYFRRNETFQQAVSSLAGSGNEISENYKWFASLIYKPENTWSAFAAIMVQYQTKEIDLSENSSYKRNSYTESFLFNPSTFNSFQSHTKIYDYNYNYNLWSAIIPVGIKAHVYGGFSFLIGTDLQFNLMNIKESGDLLYPIRIRRITENGVVTLDDIEENRPETYSSDRPTEFSKTSAIHFGAYYEHCSGIKVYVKTEGDIFNKSFWTFGLAYNY